MARKEHHAAPAPTSEQKQVPAQAPAPQEERQVQVAGRGELQEATNLDEMFMEDAGAGLNNMGAGDFAIPFLAILQKGSPQVSRANAKYIKGAEPGTIMNTVSQELYDGERGILFIPCGYNKSIVRWKPRDSGGGLVSHHKENDPIIKTLTRNERGQLIDPESNDVFIDTAYHFGLFLHEEEVDKGVFEVVGLPEWAVISMYSTQLKKSRMWNTTMRRIMIRGPQGIFNPPSYSHKYRLSTVGETKDTYDWFGWKIVSEGRIEDVELYKMAREFSKQVESGNVRISAPPQDFDESGDDVPF